jgi:hypothetical protein
VPRVRRAGSVSARTCQQAVASPQGSQTRCGGAAPVAVRNSSFTVYHSEMRGRGSAARTAQRAGHDSRTGACEKGFSHERPLFVALF